MDKPSKQELSNFVNIIKLERKKVLVAKYGQITNLLGYEQQLNSLNWLNSAQALNKQEYESKVEELNSLFKKSNSISGFRSNKQ